MTTGRFVSVLRKDIPNTIGKVNFSDVTRAVTQFNSDNVALIHAGQEYLVQRALYGFFTSLIPDKRSVERIHVELNEYGWGAWSATAPSGQHKDIFSVLPSVLKGRMKIDVELIWDEREHKTHYNCVLEVDEGRVVMYGQDGVANLLLADGAVGYVPVNIPTQLYRQIFGGHDD